LPFVAETTWGLVAKHLEEAPPDPRTLSVDLPEALAQVIVRALAKAPAERYQSATELYEALDRVAP
jgi:serine/threonine-protein kinase